MAASMLIVGAKEFQRRLGPSCFINVATVDERQLSILVCEGRVWRGVVAKVKCNPIVHEPKAFPDILNRERTFTGLQRNKANA